ncbi:THUMP-like domain-containing protein [Corynebacterium aquatimens]|uniref:THUMP-like domain-containing protein n=1 Tax=Corynebacterium aquatimens TaxID=1190508 RepID=A0A931DZ72_9CORY|nr:SAM-dependent methyltransferase [Corynebacterium aquatimens]MBG6121388.1 hypothetical protein [Corynebacterium aquatimens]WJY66067.1 hypothetical protein CAQUA_06830 [Corynebacterium aquatimens]
MSFTPDDVRFLATHLDAIDEVTPELGLTKASAFSDHAHLSERFGDRARAVAELITARQRAAAKFPSVRTEPGASQPARSQPGWLMDSDSAQQATPHPVAQVRAGHLHAAGIELVHDVTCSIASEAPAMLELGMSYLGSDLDFSRLLMARHNVELFLNELADADAAPPDAAPRAWLARADALAPIMAPVSAPALAPASSRHRPTHTAIVADPARRADGRRITDPAKLIPPLPDLIAAHPGAHMSVKCAPGIDYSGWDGLVSVVSVDGGVKEACLYTPGLSDARREAVVIRTATDAGTDAGAGTAGAAFVAERVRDGDGGEVGVDKHGAFIVEPDGAVIRAGLVQQWAARHGLWMLDPRIAFLTGDAIPAGWSGFRVRERVPLKKLKAALAAHDAGAVEILVRGVNVDPDALRKKMKLRGDASRAVVIAREGTMAVAYVCDARERG